MYALAVGEIYFGGRGGFINRLDGLAGESFDAELFEFGSEYAGDPGFLFWKQLGEGFDDGYLCTHRGVDAGHFAADYAAADDDH